jgi:hypothetical protein
MFAGLDLDLLATAQMHLKAMLLVSGLRVREGESRALIPVNQR